MKVEQTFTPSQIALWVERLNPKPKQRTVPGPAMTLSHRRGTRKPAPEAPEKPATACIHRIRLDEPSGPIVIGRCSLCGFEREYTVCPPELNTSLTVKADRGGRW